QTLTHRLPPPSPRRAPPGSVSCPPASPPHIYTLSLHDALPICDPSADDAGSGDHRDLHFRVDLRRSVQPDDLPLRPVAVHGPGGDRKSTRLNSSHVSISYAVFCLKKKKKSKTREPSCEEPVTVT